MSIRDKFVYVTTKEQDQTCIGLTEKSGKYHGVVYKYGKVGFGEENPDGTKPLRFEYNIVDNNGIPREQFGEEFFKLIGDILVEVMEEQIKDEPVDRKNSSK
tara:strand:- start:34 stop:339 length:306 start_codon:yes stop_codon:yes gene_type:complete